MRDFASKSYQKNSHNPAKKKTSQQIISSDKGLPIGRWILAIILLIILCLGLYYLWHTHTQQKPILPTPAQITKTVKEPTISTTKTAVTKTNTSASTAQPLTTPAKNQPQKPSEKTKPKPPAKPQFDFYTVLPKRTVKAPTDDQAVEARKPKSFMLQVASYQSKNKTQAMKARLLLIGLKPQIVTTSNGWYRIDLGPLNSVRDADILRHKLQKNGINGSMVRQINH